MTQISRLTQISEAADNDILPIWDADAERTRGVLASTLKEYVAADEVVNAKIVNDHLILITKDGNEIDAGLLPSSDGIDLQNDGADIGEFSTLNFGEGLVAKPSETFGVVAEVDIDKDKVYTKDVDLPIKIDDLTDITRITTGSGLYSLKKDSDAELVNRAPFARTLRFDSSLTLSEPYDGLTAIYATTNTAVDDVFHLDIDPDDPRLNKDWVFTVAIDSDITKSTLECKIGKTNPISFNLATGFAVLEVDSQNGVFVIHNQSSTVTGDLPSTFCDLSNVEWKNIPSKEWIVRDGTLAGFGTGIDGKTARLRCQVSNSSIDTTEIGLRAIDHVYTIISDDATINGRVFVRSSKSKATFDAATLREETNSAGSGSITIDGNSAGKIVSGDGIKTTFDPASNTATLIAEDFDQPDVAGFGTVSELPRHLIKPQLDAENLTYTYDDDKFNAKFANGEPGPAFKITAQKLGQTKWELGFTYADRLTSYETVMSRMLIQFLPGESTGTFDDLIKKIEFRCEKGIAGVFKHEHEGQDLLELWCIAATSEFPNRFFLELDLSANDDKYVFNTREPQFTEYLFPWNDINKPPQFVQLEEGMNNQGKMGSGSNIDSGSITQGKVFVDDFNPSNGGPEGLEGEARKGYVIKHYGFNDQPTASVIWFYNFVGDIYVKMNKDQLDKGRWNKVTGSRFANTRTFMLTATEQEYLEVDRTTPVIVTEEIDSLTLCKATDPESETDLPKVRKATVGELASGFSVCPDGTAADTQILQASSGTYSLDTMVFAVGASVDDPVYVGPDGKLTLDQSDYVVGWVLSDGVIIDIDLYNATVTNKSNQPDSPTFKNVNIDTAGSGQPNFTTSIHQDGELHTLIDATRGLRVNYKDIGTGAITTVAGIDNTQAQFLVPIYQGNDAVALAKNIPNTDSFIQKHTNAELNKLFCAYQGKYGDNRAFYPVSLYQDVNGWSQIEFTGNMVFKAKDKDTGALGNKVFEVKSNGVATYKPLEILEDATYSGATTNPTNLINRKTLDDEPQKEWFSVASGNLATDGSRPTGDSGVEGELAVWHNVTSESTTDPANELKIAFDGAYGKVDDFSKPLRFKLSQQSGARNQYWTVDDNGWQTDGNVWHLSASKVTGDNLVVGIGTTVEASALFLADVSDEIDQKIAADKAKGEWIGGVYKDTINDDGNPGDDFTCNNPKHWLEYRKTTFQGDYALIVRQGDEPISSEIVIHLHPSSGMNSTQFQVVTSDGKTSTKTIRLNEKWRFFLRKGTWPYYERIDDGASGYILEDQFNAKSGYSALESGGGSTKTITYSDNGKIIKVSNSTVKVEMLQGMNADEKKHGYFKYINARNADVAFEWYDRNGTQVTNNVPSVCPADTVVEIFADYAKDQYVLTFGQSKVISSVGEEQVQQIVSKSFDSLLEPGEGIGPFSKHPLPNPQGYLSTYASVMYDDDDRLVIPRNAYDRSLMELFFEANKSTAYCTIPVATAELLMGRILRPEDIELGVALDQSTAITPGIYGGTTPSNVPSTWAWNGKFIPLNTEAGEHNDPNNPTVWLSQDGDYVYSESDAGDKPKYGQMSISDLMSKDGQTWRHALRRGYIMKDGSFVFDAESPYYVFVIKISGYQTPQSKIHTTFFNRGGIKLYPDAISAYVDQEKIREQLDELSEGLAQGFIYAKEVSVG